MHRCLKDASVFFGLKSRPEKIDNTENILITPGVVARERIGVILKA